MKMRLSFVVLCVALLGFAPAPFAKKERRVEDQADVNGTWEIVQWWDEGKRRSPENEGAFLVEVKKDRYSYVVKKSGKVLQEFSMTLSPKSQPPGFTRHEAGRVVIVGSYRLQKEQMTMIYSCRGKGLADRPTDFAAQVEYRLVLRRIKRD